MQHSSIFCVFPGCEQYIHGLRDYLWFGGMMPINNDVKSYAKIANRIEKESASNKLIFTNSSSSLRAMLSAKNLKFFTIYPHKNDLASVLSNMKLSGRTEEEMDFVFSEWFNLHETIHYQPHGSLFFLNEGEFFDEGIAVSIVYRAIGRVVYNGVYNIFHKKKRAMYDTLDGKNTPAT